MLVLPLRADILFNVPTKREMLLTSAEGLWRGTINNDCLTLTLESDTDSREFISYNACIDGDRLLHNSSAYHLRQDTIAPPGATLRLFCYPPTIISSTNTHMAITNTRVVIRSFSQMPVRWCHDGDTFYYLFRSGFVVKMEATSNDQERIDTGEPIIDIAAWKSCVFMWGKSGRLTCLGMGRCIYNVHGLLAQTDQVAIRIGRQWHVLTEANGFDDVIRIFRDPL
jgi:hypothetical protein